MFRKKLNKKMKLSEILGNNNFGYIELITPNLISGWALSRKSPLVEIRLICNNQTIGATKIDLIRHDVSNHYNYNFKTGFNLNLGPKMKINSGDDFSLLACNSDEKIFFELKHIQKSVDYKVSLRKLLLSDIIGSIGYVEGISPTGRLNGYAFNKYNEDTLNIWLHSDSIKSQKVPCDSNIENLPEIKDEHINDIHQFCAIDFNLKNMKENIYGKKVWFSFDEEGEFLINQSANLKVPNINEIKLKKESFLINSIDDSFLEELSKKELANLDKSNYLIKKFANYIDDYKI